MNDAARRFSNQFRCTFTLRTLVRNVRVPNFLLLQHRVCVQPLRSCDTRQVRNRGYVKNAQWVWRRQRIPFPGQIYPISHPPQNRANPGTKDGLRFVFANVHQTVSHFNRDCARNDRFVELVARPVGVAEVYRNLFDGEVQSSWGAVTAMAVGESAPGSFTSFKMHGVRFASSRVRVCQHANHQGYSRIWPAVAKKPSFRRAR